MKTYIIAEVGPNHNGSIDLAIEYIQKLSEIGVDAIKFQLAIPEKLYSKSAFFVEYQKKNVTLKTPLEMGKKYQFSFEKHKLLYEKCKENNITYLCSAFDLESIKFLNKNFDLEYFKIGSGEIFSLDIIDYISKINKPILLSTGFSSFKEIKISLDLFNQNFNKDITILHCISRYPTPTRLVNLAVMNELKRRFKYSVGFSDHTMGNDCAIAAVALGAKVIEKHVTMDNDLPGPDHKASITIDKFSNLVKSIRNIEEAIGSPNKIITDEEIKVSQFARKSIVSNRKIKKSEIISKDMICYKRPGNGYLPIELDKVIGKKASVDIEENIVIRNKHLL